METPIFFKIKNAIESYNVHLEKIKDRRIEWNSHTKKSIADALKSIVENYAFGWDVRLFDSPTNCETIRLFMLNQKSDFVDTNKDHSTGIYQKNTLIKIGGYLDFNQSPNGNIIIQIGFPYIDSLVYKTPARNIKEVEPKSVDIDFIEEQVVTFLELMGEWELFHVSQIVERKAIGF